MQIKPIQGPSFGIYKTTDYTRYGYVIRGLYRDMNIEIYVDKSPETLDTKLFYISDIFKNFLRSKFIFFDKGKKRTVNSYGKTHTPRNIDINL